MLRFLFLLAILTIPLEVFASFDSPSLKRSIESYLGTPYLWGGSSRNGIDCSGFTQKVYGEQGIYLPRHSAYQFKVGKPVKQEELLFGDLVFFKKYGVGPINHVSIYLGGAEKKFVHSLSGSGVIISSLNDWKWQVRYAGARRIIPFSKEDTQTFVGESFSLPKIQNLPDASSVLDSGRVSPHSAQTSPARSKSSLIQETYQNHLQAELTYREFLGDDYGKNGQIVDFTTLIKGYPKKENISLPTIKNEPGNVAARFSVRTYPEQPTNSIKLSAGVKSLLLPGWGQFHNQQPEKGFWTTFSWGMSTALAINSHKLAEESWQKYLTAFTPEEAGKYYKETILHDKEKVAFSILTGIVWAYAVIDATIVQNKQSQQRHTYLLGKKRTSLQLDNVSSIPRVYLSYRFE